MSKLKITVHPGEILNEEFLRPLGITQATLAERIGVSRRRINELVNGRRAITADTAKRLAKAFGTTAQFWMNLQSHHDLMTTRNPTGIRKFKVMADAS